MKIFQPLLLAAALAAGNAGAEPLQAHPALYSFLDVYRLTVVGDVTGASALPEFPLGEAPARLAVAQAPAAGEPRFTIGAAPGAEKWLLLLSGLALAGWVAHRRLVHSW